MPCSFLPDAVALARTKVTFSRLPRGRFCIINAGVLYVYFSSFQQIDEEDYGGTWELTKEGFMTSFALFLVGVVMVPPTGPVCVDAPVWC